VADVLLGMVDIDLLLLLPPPCSACKEVESCSSLAIYCAWLWLSQRVYFLKNKSGIKSSVYPTCHMARNVPNGVVLTIGPFSPLYGPPPPNLEAPPTPF
jgi:hypothetical protein